MKLSLYTPVLLSLFLILSCNKSQNNKTPQPVQETQPQEGPTDPVNPNGQTPPVNEDELDLDLQDKSEQDINDGVVYSVEELSQLAISENVADRLIAAQNTSTPQNLLNKLARDPDASVQIVVASNPTLDLIAMGFLSRSSVVEVRLAVAQNPSATAAIINTLRQDGNESVREAAERAAQRLG